MARTLTFDRATINFVEVTIDPADSTVNLRLGTDLGTTEGLRQDHKFSGWGGVTAAQKSAFLSALSALVKARLIAILATDTATHDLVQSGATFTEQMQ